MTEKNPRHLATLIVLLLLTAATAGVSEVHPTWLAIAVLSLALAKVLLVAFRFMKLRHAHLFWKCAVLLITCATLGSLLLGFRPSWRPFGFPGSHPTSTSRL